MILVLIYLLLTICLELYKGQDLAHLLFFFKKNIYLFALGFSCSTWDLLLWCADSLVVAHRFQGVWALLLRCMWDPSSLTRD